MIALLLISNPKSDSLCSSILGFASKFLKQNGFKILVRDLYDPIFDPVLSSVEISGFVPDDVIEEQRLIKKSNLIVVIHPVWWFCFPAVLKGWYDRVLISDFAFEHVNGQKKGKLNNKKVVCFQTAGSQYSLNKSSQNIILTEKLWNYCGVNEFSIKVFFSNRNLDIEKICSDVESQLKLFL